MFGSNSNVILTRQTCGHRSSRLAGSKHRALAFCYSVRIWYMFSISLCREKSDLGVCMTSVLAKRTPLRSANFQRILRPNTFVNPKSALRGCIPFESTEIMHRPRSDCPLSDISISRTHTKFVRNNKMLALGVFFPQPCSNDGRSLAASK